LYHLAGAKLTVSSVKRGVKKAELNDGVNGFERWENMVEQEDYLGKMAEQQGDPKKKRKGKK
jgi:hypothetical protein